MKAFEDKLTAWIDGELHGEELAAFEQELAAHPEAEREKAEALKLGDLLRQHPTAPSLTNGDFFNHQLTQRIAAESRQPRRETSTRSAFWPIWRMAGAGAFCVLLTFVLYKAMIQPAAVEPSPYFAQVVDAWPSDPSISATTVYNEKDNVTVLWLSGLEYLPASTALQ